MLTIVDDNDFNESWDRWTVLKYDGIMLPPTDTMCYV